jgi:hypothetical protein
MFWPRSRHVPILALVAAAFLRAPAALATDGAGAISLTISPSVRGEGMGGLYAAQAQDYSSRWGNPALLAFVNKSTVGLMYSKLVPDLADDVFYFYGGWVWPTKSIGTLQLDMTYLSYGQSEATDSDGNPIGTFSSYEFSPAVGLGFQFLPNFGLGVAVKYVRVDLAPTAIVQRIDPQGSGSGTGGSWAFDLGGQFRWQKLSIGGVAANLGPDISFIDADQSDPMPRTSRLGAMYDVYGSEVGEVRFGAEWERSLVAGAADGNFDQMSDLFDFSVYHLGTEFVYNRIFAVRAGYVHDRDGDIKSATGGFGFTWANAGFEYANAPQASGLDRVHRFALWYRY